MALPAVVTVAAAALAALAGHRVQLTMTVFRLHLTVG
jgi:hypothetical protein